MKLGSLKQLHIVLQFVVLVDFTASILFIVFSEMPVRYQALENSNFCNENCKAILNRRYFSAGAVMELPHADTSFVFKNLENYQIYACQGNPSLSASQGLIQYDEPILNYSFSLSFGTYYFLPDREILLTINNESRKISPKQNYSVDVEWGDYTHIIVNNAFLLKIEYQLASTESCVQVLTTEDRADANYYIFRQKLFGNDELIPSIVGETKYYDAAYIVLLSLMALSVLIQIEIVVFFVYSVKKSLQNSSRMAGLTHFIDSNMI